MRVVPDHQVIEYLDSIGVKSPAARSLSAASPVAKSPRKPKPSPKPAREAVVRSPASQPATKQHWAIWLLVTVATLSFKAVAAVVKFLWRMMFVVALGMVMIGMQNGLVAQEQLPPAVESLPSTPVHQAPVESRESVAEHMPLLPILQDFANPYDWTPWHPARGARHNELPIVEVPMTGPVLVAPNKESGDVDDVAKPVLDPVTTPPAAEVPSETDSAIMDELLPPAKRNALKADSSSSHSKSPKPNFATPRTKKPVFARRPVWDRSVTASGTTFSHQTKPLSLGVLLVWFGGLMIVVFVYLERKAIKTQWAGAVGWADRRTATDSPHPTTLPRVEPPSTGDAELPRSTHVSTNTWRLGVDSIKGNVRSENQDSSTAFDLNGKQVLLIADGCGGVPRGAEASCLAIEACATEMFRKLVSGQESAMDAIAAGFAAAGDALASRGAELNMTNLCDGLRTTLIVVIGEPNQFCFGYIGDGAVKVVRNTGDVEDLMIQHRADAAATNVLAASLGPTPHGAAEFGCSPRAAGDVLLGGTDGVFDRVDDRFVRELMRMAIFQKGDLMKTVKASLEQLSNIVDETGGFVCDDNLTLGLMADGAQPDFRPKFWN